MKLSIITVNRNDREGLDKTIRSVLEQTRRTDVEYIVVDGDSRDGSAELVRDFAEKGCLDQWLCEPDTGIYNAMNKGVRLSSGEYLLFLNSGDTLHTPRTLEEALPLLGKEDLVIGTYLSSNGDKWHGEENLSLLHFISHTLPHEATFIKRDLLIRRPYDETLRIASDWKFFLLAVVQDNASYVNIPHTITDFDCNGVSSKNPELSLRERESVLRQLFPPRILSDYIHFCNGDGYGNTEYDNFFVRLRNYRSARVLYTLDILVLRVLALFKESARFARQFPLSGKKALGENPAV